MKWLVTGSSGYIGQHVILSMLENGFELVGMDAIKPDKDSNVASKIKHFQIDLMDTPEVMKLIQNEKCQGIINLAALKSVEESIKNPSTYFRVNCEAPMNLLKESSNYGNRIEYKLLQQQLRLNQLDRKRYLVGYAPSIYAFGTHQNNAFAGEGKFNELYNRFYPGTTIGLSVNLPIFDGLRKHAQTQQASISIAKTENDIKFFENVIDQQIFAAKTDFNRAKKQLVLQQSNFKLAEDIYNTAQLKYKNGVGSSLELTIAQTDLENARSNMLTTSFELFVAELELKKALGQIN
jgi:outer membrane protein TolC